MSKPIGLYLHVPYCERKCDYCNFVITTSAEETHKSLYFKYLESQIKYLSKRYNRPSADTIYFGGGTPSLLNPEQIRLATEMLTDAFDLSDVVEFTVEMNPSDVTQESVEAWVSAGMNRISLGVQAFQNRLLKKCNRNHTVSDIQRSMDLIRESGIKNCSGDLIIRLPDQTVEDVAESCRRSVASGFNQIVIYDLEVHSSTVFDRRIAEGSMRLPDHDEHNRMYDEVEKILTKENDFIRYELLSFARPGYESEHNMHYWRNEPYLGLGPGAFSYMEGVRFQFSGDVQRYFSKVRDGDFSNDVEDRLTDEQIEMETLLTGLRLKDGVELKNFPLLKNHLESILPDLTASDRVRNDNGRISLTDSGVRIAECVFEALSL